MTLFAQLAPLSSAELTIALLGIVVVCGGATWLFIRWMAGGPVSPDPWDEQVAAELADDTATALCHRCLSPHDSNVYFCQECGAPVGQYTNLLPFPYLFSIGHTLRLGTSGEFKHSRLIICGFILFTLAEYMIFAPVYWFCFLRNLSRPAAPAAHEGPSASA